MTVVYCENVPLYATVKRWAAEFCRGRKSLEDEPRSGHPSEAVCEENCHALETVVPQNRRVNVHLIADTVGISTGSAKMILRKLLLTTKVCVLDQKMKDFDAKHQVKI